MRETGPNGQAYEWMPKDPDKAIEVLARLGSLAAASEWKRAAIVATICERKKGRGNRPKGNAGNTAIQKMNMSELARVGLYGLRTTESVSAYLDAWAKSGLPSPEFGAKIELPIIDFPVLYERKPAKVYLNGDGEIVDLDALLKEQGIVSEEVEDDGDEGPAEDEAEEKPSPRGRSGRSGAAGGKAKGSPQGKAKAGSGSRSHGGKEEDEDEVDPEEDDRSMESDVMDLIHEVKTQAKQVERLVPLIESEEIRARVVAAAVAAYTEMVRNITGNPDLKVAGPSPKTATRRTAARKAAGQTG